MTEHLLSSDTGAAIANHLWQSTVLVALVWLLTLLLRRNQAKVRYGLWLAASLKFLVPFSLLIALGGLLPWPRHAVAVSQPTLYSTVDVMAQPFSEIAILPVAPQAASLRERLAASLPLVLMTVWGCGMVTVLLIWCVRWRRVLAILRRAVPAESGREVEMLRRLELRENTRRKMVGERPMLLLLSQELMEPGIFGIFRPVLLWPERLSERLEDEHIEAILAHERMHVCRYDNLTAVLHMFVEAVFWFHPLVWWIERRMIDERERACDEARGCCAGGWQTGDLCRKPVEGLSLLCGVAAGVVSLELLEPDLSTSASAPS